MKKPDTGKSGLMSLAIVMLFVVAGLLFLISPKMALIIFCGIPSVIVVGIIGWNFGDVGRVTGNEDEIRAMLEVGSQEIIEKRNRYRLD